MSMLLWFVGVVAEISLEASTLILGGEMHGVIEDRTKAKQPQRASSTLSWSEVQSLRWLISSSMVSAKKSCKVEDLVQQSSKAM